MKIVPKCKLCKPFEVQNQWKKIPFIVRGTNKVQVYDKNSNKKQSTKINLLLLKC